MALAVVLVGKLLAGAERFMFLASPLRRSRGRGCPSRTSSKQPADEVSKAFQLASGATTGQTASSAGLDVFEASGTSGCSYIASCPDGGT